MAPSGDRAGRKDPAAQRYAILAILITAAARIVGMASLPYNAPGDEMDIDRDHGTIPPRPSCRYGLS